MLGTRKTSFLSQASSLKCMQASLIGVRRNQRRHMRGNKRVEVQRLEKTNRKLGAEWAAGDSPGSRVAKASVEERRGGRVPPALTA